MLIHNFRTVDETGYMLLVMAEKRVGNPQKMKTDLAITIQPSTLSWREAESHYKTDTIIKPEVKINDGQWSCVCPMLRLDLPRRSWISPSYRGSAARPTVSAHFVEHNGAFCMDALSRSYDPFSSKITLPFMILAVAFGTHTTHKGQTSITPVGFEPTISAGERP